MKTTPAHREWLRSGIELDAKFDSVDMLWVLDDLEETMRALEDARDRMQKMELELGSIRGQMPGGDL